ncbi:serine/threonine kinase [Fragilaria crotonensis]|nr:serine/threonine kinase [Fragilaria crotonensis]
MTSFHGVDYLLFPNSSSKLIEYAIAGNLEKVRDHLRKEEDVNVKNEHGNTALVWASNNGHLEVVRALLMHNGVDVNIKDHAGASALYYASYNGHVEVVRALLNHNGVDVNIKDNDGDTPLICASLSGHLEVVRALLHHQGVDVNIQTNYGDTALIWASFGGHEEVVRALLNHDGVNVNIQNNDGRTALILASRKCHLDVVRAILDHDGVDVNVRDKYGYTALDIARKKPKIGVARLLEDHMERLKLDVEKNPAGSDASRRKGRRKRLKVTNTTSTNPVDVNLQSSDGKTALHMASQNGLVEVVRALVQLNNVDVNMMDNDGSTALILASEKGHLEVVRALLKHDGMNVNVQNNDGETALDVARSRQNEKVSCLLQEHMKALAAHYAETEQERKRARTQPSTSEPSEVEEQSRYDDAEPQQKLLNRKPAGSRVDAQIEKDRNNLLHITADLKLSEADSRMDLDSEEEEQRMYDAAQIEQDRDRSKLLHVMNTSSADPVELSLEFIERCIKKDHKLGSGSFGDVFLAEDSRLPKKFAVKVIRTNTKCNEAAIKEMRRSFQRELSTLKTCRHPNIIVLYGYSLTANSTQQCLVYEYAANGSLAAFFTDNGNKDRLSADTRLSIMFKLVRAVHFLHTGGCKVDGEGWKVFHRDIKSANICLADDLTPRLIDCGLATFVPDDNSSATLGSSPVTLQSTTGGFAFGTPGYMCPFYVKKKGAGNPCPYIAACDVYSIGVVLVELILGCLNGVRSTRNDSQFLDVFEKYVQHERTYHRIVDGWKNLIRDADPTVMWNQDALEIACRAAIQCMDPFPELRLSTKDLLDTLSDAVLLNNNAGIQHPVAESAVQSGPYCLICNEYRTDITCSEGHALCPRCIIDKLGDHSGCQLLCLIKECSSKLQDTDLYGRIPLEMYNRYVKKRAMSQI